MQEKKEADLVPFSGAWGTKIIPMKKICVKVYLNEPEFLDWIKKSEDAGIRPRGLKPFRVKPKGFADERIANTKGLVKFIKKRLFPFWLDGEETRKIKEAEILEGAKKLGLEIRKK